MGYRSSGMIYLSDEVQKMMRDELAKDLVDCWDKHETADNVWTFDGWKWYTDYNNISMWENFLSDLSEDYGLNKEWDICIIGEDGAINEDICRTYTKFNVYTKIEMI